MVVTDSSASSMEEFDPTTGLRVSTKTLKILGRCTPYKDVYSYFTQSLYVGQLVNKLSVFYASSEPDSQYVLVNLYFEL